MLDVAADTSLLKQRVAYAAAPRAMPLYRLSCHADMMPSLIFHADEAAMMSRTALRLSLTPMPLILIRLPLLIIETMMRGMRLRRAGAVSRRAARYTRVTCAV